MEIFQTIWDILITQNQKMAKTIISPFAFIEALLYMMIFTTVLKITYNKKQQKSGSKTTFFKINLLQTFPPKYQY